MKVTDHAAQRWTERFGDIDMAQAYARASQRVGKKTKAKIKAACPAHVRFVSGPFLGRYFAMTDDKIVFVVTPPETIITVFRLGDKDKKGPSK